MVKYDPDPLNRTFAALADPTRRAILQRLADDRRVSVSQLAEPFDMSLPGLMKHIDYLEQAGLVSREKEGRTVHCRLNAAPMEDAVRWLARYEEFWTERLEALAAYLESDPCPNATNQASPSSATSKPARKKSSRRGRKPNT